MFYRKGGKQAIALKELIVGMEEISGEAIEEFLLEIKVMRY
jgi:hypothetical protein